MLGTTPKEREKIQQLSALNANGLKEGREYFENEDGEMMPRPKPNLTSKWGQAASKAVKPVRSVKPADKSKWVERKGSDIDELLEFLAESLSQANMGEGERDFIDSLRAWADNHGGLTIKQYNKLAEMADTVEDRIETRGRRRH